MKAIPSESFKERVETMNNIKKLSRGELISAIVGMVIGDGCLSKKVQNSKNNAYYQMTHSIKQMEYFIWKINILEQIAHGTIHDTKSGKTDIKDCVHFSGKTNPLFTQLYDRFYFEGKKVVDEYLVKKIDPLALSIIYMDDGTLGKGYKKYWTKETFYLKLCNFDYANLFLIKKSLKIIFDLDWNINKHSTVNGRTYYQLRLLNAHNQAFVDIVKPYVELIPSMLYKLGSYANQLNN